MEIFRKISYAKSKHPINIFRTIDTRTTQADGRFCSHNERGVAVLHTTCGRASDGPLGEANFSMSRQHSADPEPGSIPGSPAMARYASPTVGPGSPLSQQPVVRNGGTKK